MGALAGGALTFGLLAFIGSAVDGVGATVVSIAIALSAALAEARGVAIAPQIRRQVPERWRRTLPLPLAAGLYGLLLGLGFTTFVLTFAVWALAALSFAAADPALGVAVGLAFGAGRTLPIVAIAPVARRPLGTRLLEAMAERPSILRRLRLADAVALTLACAALVAAEAHAATNLGRGTDPSTSGVSLAWSAPEGGVFVRAEGEAPTTLPGKPVLGGSLVAWRNGGEIHVAVAADLSPVLDLSLPAVDALAVSDRWLVTREPRPDRGDQLVARALAAIDQPRTVATFPPPTQLGRPALDGDLLVFHVATPARSRIVAFDLAAWSSSVVRSSRVAQLTNPSVLAGRLLYVRQTSTAQLLELGALTGKRDRALYRLGAPAKRDRGFEPGQSHVTRTPRPKRAVATLWTTALGERQAYVTFVPRAGGNTAASIVAVPR